jgi:DNA-binding transcriptional LysR family regulator
MKEDRTPGEHGEESRTGQAGTDSSLSSSAGDMPSAPPRRCRMTLTQLEAFAAVAKYSSLTRASLELRVSQPSISQQLRQLETERETKLYRRVSKGIELTESGHVFLPFVTQILDLIAQLETRSKAPRARKFASNLLRVGGTARGATVFLPGILAEFQRRYPKAEVEFRTGASEQLERLVAHSGMDVAVVDREPLSPECRSDRLRQEKVAMFVPPSHTLAHRKTVKLTDLLAQPLIIPGKGEISRITQRALERLREGGLTARVVMRCDADAAIKAAVRQKMGVGFVFEDSVKAEVAAGEFAFVRVRGFEIEVQSFVVYSKALPSSPLTQAFVELVRAARVSTAARRAHGRAKTSAAARPASRRPEIKPL